MSWVKQIREMEEGGRRTIHVERSDLQKKWDSVESDLLDEYRRFTGHKYYTIYLPITKSTSDTHAYVYEDERGTKFLYALFEVQRSQISSMSFPHPPIWKNGDIDNLWFETLPRDSRPSYYAERSVWNPAFWRKYSDQCEDETYRSLVRYEPEEVVDLCKEMVTYFAYDLDLDEFLPLYENLMNPDSTD